MYKTCLKKGNYIRPATLTHQYQQKRYLSRVPPQVQKSLLLQRKPLLKSEDDLSRLWYVSCRILQPFKWSGYVRGWPMAIKLLVGPTFSAACEVAQRSWSIITFGYTQCGKTKLICVNGWQVVICLVERKRHK